MSPANSSAKPKYLQLAETLRQQIRQGQLLPGQPLPTYTELARELGFSQSTVERAFSILEKERLIFRKAGSGIYVSPTPVSKSTNYIGYIDASHNFNKNFQYYAQLAAGVRQQAKEAGKCIIMIDDPESFSDWTELDGVILCEAAHYTRHQGNATKNIFTLMPPSLPCVNTMFSLPGVSNVTADDKSGMQQLLQHLIALGHERIGYMGRMLQAPMQNHPLVQLRYQTYLDTLKAHHLDYHQELVYSPPLDFYRDYISYGYEGMRLWLERGWRELGCTALLAHNDLTAIGMIDALQEADIDVPGQVSVAGFDDSETFRLASYKLTTAHVPLHEIGVTAMKTLLQRLENPGAEQQTIVLPVQLTVGKTTAVPHPTHIAAQAA